MGRPKKEKPNRADGTYEVKITIGKDRKGKLIRKSFYSTVSKDDARAKADAYKLEQEIALLTGDFPETQRTRSFESWAEEVLKSLKGTVKDSTYRNTYINIIRNHLIPYFGKTSMKNIRQIDVQNYFTNLGKTHRPETLQKHRSVIKKIFDIAVTNGVCFKNPCTGIKLKSDIKPIQKRIYTKEQCQLILSYAKTHRYGLGIHIMLNYGLSRSELLGLMWDDVDFEHKTISIRRGVSEVRNLETNQKELVIGDTKNIFRNRIIPISSETADLLNSTIKNSEFIICNQYGAVCRPSTWSKCNFDKFMKEMHDYYMNQDTPIDIPQLNAHELRHTRASIWVNDGENIFAVANVLGHADLKMLRKRYAHSDVESTRNLLGIK